MASAPNSCDESTHMVSFDIKSAERYFEPGQTFAASAAFAKFLAAGASAGVENQSDTLTTHSIGEGDSIGSRSQITWPANVSDPATLVSVWQKMSDSFDQYPRAAKAHGLQMTLLGN